MSIENGVTEYKLLRPFEYYCNEDKMDKEAYEIVLREPCPEVQNEFFCIQQLVTSIFLEINSSDQVKSLISDSKSESEDFVLESGEEVKPIHEMSSDEKEGMKDMGNMLKLGLMMSQKVNAGTFVELFKKIATNKHASKPIAMIDGKVSLTRVHLSRMHPNDVLGIAAEWCGFFAMPDFLMNRESAEQ